MTRISACRRVHGMVCSSRMWPGPGFVLFLSFFFFWRQEVETNALFVWLAPTKLGFQPLILKATVERGVEPGGASRGPGFVPGCSLCPAAARST